MKVLNHSTLFCFEPEYVYVCPIATLNKHFLAQLQIWKAKINSKTSAVDSKQIISLPNARMQYKVHSECALNAMQECTLNAMHKCQNNKNPLFSHDHINDLTATQIYTLHTDKKTPREPKLGQSKKKYTAPHTHNTPPPLVSATETRLIFIALPLKPTKNHHQTHPVHCEKNMLTKSHFFYNYI